MDKRLKSVFAITLGVLLVLPLSALPSWAGISAQCMVYKLKGYSKVPTKCVNEFRSKRPSKNLQVIGKLRSGLSKNAQVGSAPEDFAPSHTFNRQHVQEALVVWVNAADPYGVAIDNIHRGDLIEISNVTGIASFDDSKGCAACPGIIALVAAGAGVAADYYGAESTKDTITAVEELAKRLFGPKSGVFKRRDGFGQDPGTSHWARQEGGVLVHLPKAGGIYYSGKSKKRWIKEHRSRVDRIRPDHVRNAFFLVRGSDYHNTRRARANGQIIISAWDHKFEDNAGYYRLFVKITRADQAKEVKFTFRNPWTGKKFVRTRGIEAGGSEEVDDQKASNENGETVMFGGLELGNEGSDSGEALYEGNLSKETPERNEEVGLSDR